jgi:hypothetical protein
LTRNKEDQPNAGILQEVLKGIDAAEVRLDCDDPIEPLIERRRSF